MPLGNFGRGNPRANLQNPNSFGQPNWVNTGQTVLRGLQRAMPYLSQAGVQFPPVINFLMKGMKPSGSEGQGFLEQGVPQQQGLPYQGYPQQDLRVPQQGIPQQGYLQQGYPSQGFFSQGLPPQTYQQSQPSQFLSQPFPASYQPQVQPQVQALPQQATQTSAKGGGIKALISNFLARRKG